MKLNWAQSNQNTAEVFAYKFLQVNSNANVFSILLMSNSCYAARPVGICMRSYDEFAQMASLLRPYINNMELPRVPKMKRSHKKESMSQFLQWCGSYIEVLRMIVIQYFLYSDTDISEIIKKFKIMISTPSGHHSNRLRSYAI